MFEENFDAVMTLISAMQENDKEISSEMDSVQEKSIFVKRPE